MYLGIDIGFYQLKAIGNGRGACFPSHAVRARRSLESLGADEAIILEYDDGKYMVGREAVRKGNGARKETPDWIESREYLMLFHAALSEITEATQANMSVVTGLPISDVARDKATLKGRLMGVHVFTREGRHRQRITVDAVRIVPQGWGAVLSQLFDERGSVVREEFARQKVGVLDIGGHNVQYLSVEGLSDLPMESHSTEHGAWDVVRDVRTFFNAEHPGLAHLSDHQIMDAAIAGEVYDGQARIDLAPVVKPIMRDIGEEIVDTAGQYWGVGAATFRSILVCGGGAYLWGEHIQRAFPQATVLNSPEYANAQGYHNFAVYLAQKEQRRG